MGSIFHGCDRAQSPLPPSVMDTRGNGIFNRENAYNHVITQLSFGPRIPGSDGQKKFINWADNLLVSYGWATRTQVAQINGIEINNLIATRGNGLPRVLLGTHFDTRAKASRDKVPDKQEQPVPGANDGASGVAILLELARVLPNDNHGTITLAFFDAEDQGGIEELPWIIGSNYYTNNLSETIDQAIIIDMVGDENLVIYQEQNSDINITQSIWGRAKELGYEANFNPSLAYNILDDHIPFIEADIPSVLIIDMEYPYWHTTEDTIDHVSAASLSIVGNTLLSWLTSQ
jgi:glutaminyl-peptide cyclotransferase